MEKGDPFRRLDQVQRGLVFASGIVFALLVTAVAGDLKYMAGEAPLGWFLLWLPASIASLTVGLWLLVGRSWRSIPTEDRRATIMGSLLLPFVSLFGLAVLWQNQAYLPVVYCLPAGYAVALLAAYARLYRSPLGREELFP